MGPHSFECGSVWERRTVVGLERGFNGAAVVRVRKCRRAREPGGIAGSLQWGRTRSSAEMELPLIGPDDQPMRFNGAALVRVRKCH